MTSESASILMVVLLVLSNSIGIQLSFLMLRILKLLTRNHQRREGKYTSRLWLLWSSSRWSWLPDVKHQEIVMVTFLLSNVLLKSFFHSVDFVFRVFTLSPFLIILLPSMKRKACKKQSFSQLFFQIFVSLFRKDFVFLSLSLFFLYSSIPYIPSSLFLTHLSFLCIPVNNTQKLPVVRDAKGLTF